MENKKISESFARSTRRRAGLGAFLLAEASLVLALGMLRSSEEPPDSFILVADLVSLAINIGLTIGLFRKSVVAHRVASIYYLLVMLCGLGVMSGNGSAVVAVMVTAVAALGLYPPKELQLEPDLELAPPHPSAPFG